MNSYINQNDLELYQALSELQAFYRELYEDLEIQYATCSCFYCKIRLVTFGMELVSINNQIERLETKLIPSLDNILAALAIQHAISNDGSTQIIIDNNR